MKHLSTALEQELLSLYESVPLTGEILEQKAQELVWAIGHGSGDMALAALRQLVCHDMETDLEMAALAVALGFWAVVPDQGVRQRLSDFGALHDRKGDSSPRRWAMEGAATIARQIAELDRPSILISVRVDQTSPSTFDVEVEPAYRFEDHSMRLTHKYDYRLSRFALRIEDLVQLELDGFVDRQSSLVLKNLPVSVEHSPFLEFEWTGKIGFGVFTRRLLGGHELAVTTYERRGYIRLAPIAEE